jgi:hypothetical protein
MTKISSCVPKERLSGQVFDSGREREWLACFLQL